MKAPETEPTPPPSSGWGTRGVPQPWSVGEAVGHGWISFAHAAIPLGLAYLLSILANSVVGAGTGRAVEWLMRSAHVSLATMPPHLRVGVVVGASALAGIVLGAFFWGGQVRMWLAAARGDKPTLSVAFSGARTIGRLTAVSLVLLLLGVVTIPLLCVPFWGFVLAPYLVIDEDMSALAALRASWRLTRGHKGSLWMLGLCTLPILSLGVAAGGIGVCAAIPVTQLGFAYVYLRLSARSALPPYTPQFAARSLRALLRTTLAVFAAAFAAAVFVVSRLPPVHGSAWTMTDAISRLCAMLFGVATTILLLATLLPWLLDRLEGRTFALFVGARHVRSQKSGFLTVISVLSICGVAISSCALSSVVSVMGGFSHDLKRKILGNNAHIVIDTVSQKPWNDYGPVLDNVRAVPGVQGATPVVNGEVMISSASNIAGVIVRGIDPKTIGNVIDLESNIEVGKFHYLEDPDLLRHLPPDEVIGIGSHGDEYRKGSDLTLLPDDLDPSVRAAIDTAPPLRPGIIIGRELSHTLHVYVGDEVTLVSPMGDLGPMGVMPRTKKFRVAAIFYSGMYEYDATHVYTLIDVAQQYFSMDHKISAIDVKVKDAENADQLTPLVTAAANRPDLRVRDWREMNRNLFSALKLERLATFIILSLAIIVASFCIICTLLLMVTEKGKEIAVLKALGASDGDILRTFMIEGIIIGGIGTAFGVATGLAQCAGLAWFGLRLDPEVYYIDRLPVHVSGWDFLSVAVAAMIICTLATIYPAYAASKLRPVEGLRYE